MGQQSKKSTEFSINLFSNYFFYMVLFNSCQKVICIMKGLYLNMAIGIKKNTSGNISHFVKWFFNAIYTCFSLWTFVCLDKMCTLSPSALFPISASTFNKFAILISKLPVLNEQTTQYISLNLIMAFWQQLKKTLYEVEMVPIIWFRLSSYIFSNSSWKRGFKDISTKSVLWVTL